MPVYSTISAATLPANNITTNTVPEAGEYWLATNHGEDPWPVVICDENMVRSHFSTKDRPKGARQQDGTWGGEFETDGKLFGQRYFPAMKLGTMKFCWAPGQCLKPITFQTALSRRFGTNNPELSVAYFELVERYDRKDLTYWTDMLFAAKLNLEQELEESRGEKRKATAVANVDCLQKLKEEWLNDAKDQDNDLFLSSDEPVMKRAKNEFIAAMPEAENHALYKDPKPKSPSLARRAMERAMFGTPRPSLARSTTPSGARSSSIDLLSSDEPELKKIKDELIAMSVAENDALYEDPKPNSPSLPCRAMGRTVFRTARTARRSPAESIGAQSSSIVNDPNMATLYVGNPHDRFKVPLVSIKASPLLSKHLSYSVADGSYIMIPALSQMKASDFDSVSEFLHRGEYHPKILFADTPFVHLEKTSAHSGSEEHNENEIYHCGVIYCMARKLELQALQDLAVRKLKVLAVFFGELKCVLLEVVELVYGRGGAEQDKDLDEWMVGQLAEHFLGLMRAETIMFLEILDEHKGLAKRVYGVLAGNGTAKDEAEDGDKDVMSEEGMNGEVMGLDGFLEQSAEI